MRGGKVVRFQGNGLTEGGDEQIDLTVEFSELIRKVEILEVAIGDVKAELLKMTQ